MPADPTTVLLDTHVLLWWRADTQRLSASATGMIDAARRLLVSPVSGAVAAGGDAHQGQAAPPVRRFPPRRVRALVTLRADEPRLREASGVLSDPAAVQHLLDSEQDQVDGVAAACDLLLDRADHPLLGSFPSS